MLKDLVENGANMYNQMQEFQLTYRKYKKESNKNIKNNHNHGKKKKTSAGLLMYSWSSTGGP